MTDAWFKPKTHGYGAYPACWQGWALTLGYVAAMMALAIVLFIVPQNMAGRLPSPTTVVTFLAVATALTYGFIRLVRKKTKGDWRWRWEDEK